MFKFGDRVKIKSIGCSGTVVEEAAWSGTNGKAYHWVQYSHSTSKDEVAVFSADELTTLICTCGAEKTHAPRKAPGHAYYCDSI